MGAELVGHEFHYSHCVAAAGAEPPLALSMTRGSGMLHGRDGLLSDNTFASYTHIHALSTPWWAENFVRAARAHKSEAR